MKITEEGLKELGFIKSPDSGDVYTKEKFKIVLKLFPGDSELGTNIEVYQENKLKISGYWHDDRDFIQSYKTNFKT